MGGRCIVCRKPSVCDVLNGHHEPGGVGLCAACLQAHVSACNSPGLLIRFHDPSRRPLRLIQSLVIRVK